MPCVLCPSFYSQKLSVDFLQARSAKESCFESVSMAGSGLRSSGRSYSLEQVDETPNWTLDGGPSTLGDWNTISVESAGVAFADLFMDQKARGRLSAKDECLLSFFCKHAGLTGLASEWAFQQNTTNDARSNRRGGAGDARASGAPQSHSRSWCRR